MAENKAGTDMTANERIISRKKEFVNSVTFHPMRDAKDEKAAIYQRLRDIVQAAGEVVIELTPYSREQSLALTHLEDALMWAVKSVAIRD